MTAWPLVVGAAALVVVFGVGVGRRGCVHFGGPNGLATATPAKADRAATVKNFILVGEVLCKERLW